MEPIASSSCEIAWLAGVFEGEGYIGQYRAARPYLCVRMSDEDVIRRLYKVSGVGNVCGPIGPRKGQTKPIWSWHVGAVDEVSALLRAILPYLGNRRAARAREVLAVSDAIGPRRGTAPTCGYGHELTGNNLRLVDGRRRCLKCQARRQRDHRARARAKRQAPAA